MKTSIFIFVLAAAIYTAGCSGVEVPEQTNTQKQNPVFDIAMQGVDPAWFDRAMVGVDFGIHRMERYGELVADSSELIRRSLSEMDQNGILYGLLSHGSHKEAWHDAHPARFLLSFEPDLSLEDHTAAAAEFAQGVREGRYAALGELGLVYAGIPLNTPALFPYYEVAEELGVPVFIHTGFSGPDPQNRISPAFRIGTADPLLLEDVVIRFPDMKIVMMHMGWPFFDHALYMLGTYPNVYMETSVAIWVLGPALFNRMLAEAVATAGSDRILFGTLQMAWPELIGRSVKTIRDADYLTPEGKHAILWENAIRVLGLEEKITAPIPEVITRLNSFYPGFTAWAEELASTGNQ